MNGQIANSRALGFAAIAISGWTYSLVHAGWLMPSALGSGAAHDVAVFATFALLVAALASFLRGEMWHAVLFMFLSAFWWAIQTAGGEVQAQAFQGWYYLSAAVFAGLLCLSAFQSDEIEADASLVALGIALVLLGLSLTNLGLPAVFAMMAGYVGLATALLSFWVAARELDLGGAEASASATATEGAGERPGY